MNDEISAGLVPPRPNLGPEPWEPPQPSRRADLVLLALILAVLLIAALLWLRYRRRNARTHGEPFASQDIAGTDPSPRDRLVALSGSIRDALTVPFGNSCRAKTTEELAADNRLEQRLGHEELRELIRFLDQIDRLKFAPERTEYPQEMLADALASWVPRVEALRSRIRSMPKDRDRERNSTSKSLDNGSPSESNNSDSGSA